MNFIKHYWLCLRHPRFFRQLRWIEGEINAQRYQPARTKIVELYFNYPRAEFAPYLVALSEGIPDEL